MVESPEVPPRDRIISEAEVIETLTGNGVPLDDYFLIDGKLPGFVNERGDHMALVIEEDVLGHACVQFLRDRGARIVRVGPGR